MLHSLGSLSEACVLAADGEIGRVYDFLFDDQTWMVRYLAVDVRRWLTRHDVLVPVTALDQPDLAKGTIRCHLTRDQVRHSPPADTRKPVSRQQEIAMREFYGWPEYWSNKNADTIAIPVIAGRQFPVATKEDQHLRSTEAISGYKVFSESAEMGALQDFIVDEDSWHIGYLDVQTGTWLRKREVLLPTRWVKVISWADGRVVLHHSSAVLASSASKV